MSDERHGINIDAVLTKKKYVVTWKGKDAQSEWFNTERAGSAKRTTVALEHLLNRDGKKCRKCGREEYLTIDHVIPASLLREMGIEKEETYHDFENLQILCKLCNAYKAHRVDFSDRRTKPLLLKYINAIPDVPTHETETL